MTPFLSVITINKNNAAGLKGTIESVLTQEGLAAGDLEYIIIDGNSGDNSADIIKEYAARLDFPHKITHWISEEDTGIYDAINKGIRAAHGEYVAVLNSGDSYTPDALTGLKEIAQEHKGKILYGAVDLMLKGKYFQTFARCADDIPRLGMIPHEASFVPHQVYNDYGLYDDTFKILADWDLFWTFYAKGVPFFHIQKIFTNYDNGGISSTLKEAYMDEKDRVRARHGIVEKETLIKRIRYVLKMLVPYGLMLALGRVK